MRGRAAGFSASAARSISFSPARARPATTEFFTRLAISCTASKSPLEAIGKPASITSTPISSSRVAICSFSSRFIEAPGDCSPSRRVVSKMMTRFLSLAVLVVFMAQFLWSTGTDASIVPLNTIAFLCAGGRSGADKSKQPGKAEGQAQQQGKTEQAGHVGRTPGSGRHGNGDGTLAGAPTVIPICAVMGHCRIVPSLARRCVLCGWHIAKRYRALKTTRQGQCMQRFYGFSVISGRTDSRANISFAASTAPPTISTQAAASTQLGAPMPNSTSRMVESRGAA